MSAYIIVDWLVSLYLVILSENVGRGIYQLYLLHLMAGVKHPESLLKV